jgi:SAM-dependent methyltransferase
MSTYSEHFYNIIARDGDRSADIAVPVILDTCNPKSIIDVGCGSGNWLKVFSQHGIEDYFGVDGNWVSEKQIVLPIDRFARLDLSKPFSLPRTFDLALCLEVAEHLPENSADAFISSLCHLAPVIVFSAAIPGQGGTHHVNEQWPDYWARKFNRDGFQTFDFIRPQLWTNPDIQSHYAQNILVFVRKGYSPDKFPPERAIQHPEALRLVHPRLFTIRIDPTQYSIKGFFLKTLPNYLRARLGLLE